MGARMYFDARRALSVVDSTCSKPLFWPCRSFGSLGATSSRALLRQPHIPTAPEVQDPEAKPPIHDPMQHEAAVRIPNGHTMLLSGILQPLAPSEHLKGVGLMV